MSSRRRRSRSNGNEKQELHRIFPRAVAFPDEFMADLLLENPRGMLGVALYRLRDCSA